MERRVCQDRRSHQIEDDLDKRMQQLLIRAEELQQRIERILEKEKGEESFPTLITN